MNNNSNSSEINWLTNIWIIDKSSAVCIFEQSFRDITVDPDLISGFLVAIFNFGREIASKDVQSINFNDITISVKNSEKYFLATAVLNDASPEIVHITIEKISREFDENYGSFISKFCGNVNIFESFAQHLEKILQKRSTGKRILVSKRINQINPNDDDYSYVSKIENEVLNNIDNIEDDYGSFYEPMQQETKHISKGLQDVLLELGKKNITEMDYNF